MSQRLRDIGRMLGESRRRLGALDERLAALRARLGGPGPAPEPVADDTRETAPLGTADIESLDLKFEAIGVGGPAPGSKLPEG